MDLIKYKYKCDKCGKDFSKTKDVHQFGSYDYDNETKTTRPYFITCNGCKHLCKCVQCLPDCKECLRSPLICICCKLCKKPPKKNPITKEMKCNCVTTK